MSKFPYSVVEKLSFVRYGGTEEELKAAKLLQEEMASFGGKGELMDFEIDQAVCQKCSMKVAAPYEQEIPTIHYGLSGCLPEGGVDLKLVYAERGLKEDYDYAGIKDLSGCAVLINELNIDAYEQLIEKKASAFITIHGKHYDDVHSASMYTRNLRPFMLEKGKVPGFMICAADAMELINKGATTLHLELQQTEGKATSRDILAVIPGTEIPEESIVITGHYDSVPLGTGSWDNATGSAALMYIYRYFLQNPPKRTLRFIWCGSEEQGLLGSKAYVQQHEDLLPEIKLCFNFDMCGTILGENHVFLTGTDELMTFAKQFCREQGYSATFRMGVHSSDSAPFADKGIPGIGLSRGTKTAEIHTIHDLMPTLSPEQMILNSEFACKMISRVANSAQLPVGTGMPDNMKKELDKYFKRTR